MDSEARNPIPNRSGIWSFGHRHDHAVKAHAPAEHVCEVVDPIRFLLYFWRRETGGAAIRRAAVKPVSLSMWYGPAMTRKGRLGLARLGRV